MPLSGLLVMRSPARYLWTTASSSDSLLVMRSPARYLWTTASSSDSLLVMRSPARYLWTDTVIKGPTRLVSYRDQKVQHAISGPTAVIKGTARYLWTDTVIKGPARYLWTTASSSDSLLVIRRSSTLSLDRLQ